MAKNLQNLVRNVASTSGNVSNQARKGIVAMQRTEAMVLSSPRHSMPTQPAHAGSCTASRDLALLSAGKAFEQRRSWPTGKCFPGQIATPVIFSGTDSYPTARDDSGYTTRRESWADLPATGLVRG